ncbi:MAG TPA: trigger factor [Candidatus Marinimicrobia bacterium]|nr:trigger factor [Candidatus Neomarinimicrobiota bacterium]
MKVTVTEISNVEQKIRVDFDWNEVETHYNDTLNKLRKGLKVDGFRPGKVPPEIARRLLEPRLSYDFTNAVVESSYTKVLKEQGINAYIDLKVRAVDFDFGENFYYEITIETDPEIDLPDYKSGFTVKKPVYVVDKEDVDLYLEDIREHFAEVHNIDDGAREGHYILCDLQEVDSGGIPLVGRKVSDRLIKVGEGIFGEPGSEGLIGAKTGDELRIKLKPKKGKSVDYLVTVKRVEERRLPELNDDFVKQHYQTMDNIKELRAQVEKMLQAEWDSRSVKEFQRAVSDYFLDNVKTAVPKSRIDRLLENIIADIKEKNDSDEIEETKLREQYRPLAEREVRWFLIEQAIAGAENIEVAKEELEQKVQELVESYAEDKQPMVRNYFSGAKNRTRLENDLFEKKIFDHLEKYARVKKEKISTKEFRKRNM